MQNTNESFIVSSQKIEIPEEFRTIVVRANYGKSSPFKPEIKTLWPTSGCILSQGKKGLFGILLSQDFDYLRFISFIVPVPIFFILEVDSRTLSNAVLDPSIEVEFSFCNILFSGYIDGFFNRIQEYATDEQLNKLHISLDFKLKEVHEALKNPDSAMTYIAKSVLRATEIKNISSSKLRMYQLLSWIQLWLDRNP